MPHDARETQGEDRAEMARPRGYANALRIDFSLAEFTLDFLQSFAGDGGGAAQCRLVTSPANMAAFAEAMRGALEDYERRYGALPGPRED